MKTSYRSLIIRSLIVGVLAGGAAWYFSSPAGPIVPYNAARDRAFIIDLFKKNWYMLISDYHAEDFDVPFMLDRRSPSGGSDRGDTGVLIMKTYLENNEPIGFILYYPKKLKVGQLLFLGVAEEHRRKGIARKLANYAIEDMKRLGMLGVKLTTRTENTKAQSLYESMSFKQIWTDGAYVNYEKIF